jgi:hypothetical protein
MFLLHLVKDVLDFLYVEYVDLDDFGRVDAVQTSSN